jgi:hypothetical protein
MRHLLLIVLFVGGFWYLTSHLPSRLSDVSFLNRVSGSDSPLRLTEANAAPSYDSQELNNISVYKRVLPSVVNITSRQVVFNFFYGAVPQEGQGSGSFSTAPATYSPTTTSSMAPIAVSRSC